MMEKRIKIFKYFGIVLVLTIIFSTVQGFNNLSIPKESWYDKSDSFQISISLGNIIDWCDASKKIDSSEIFSIIYNQKQNSDNEHIKKVVQCTKKAMSKYSPKEMAYILHQGAQSSEFKEYTSYIKSIRE